MRDEPTLSTKLFSFRGRMDRVGFLAMLSLTLGGFIASVAAITVTETLLRRAHAAPIWIGLCFPVLLASAALMFWPVAAIAIKRIRGIGLPVWTLVVWALFPNVLLKLGGVDWLEPYVNMSMLTLLAGWPSKEEPAAPGALVFGG